MVDMRPAVSHAAMQPAMVWWAQVSGCLEQLTLKAPLA
jgi:hypothetical protein